MKKLSFLFVLSLILGLLAGCAGTSAVSHTGYDSPESDHTDVQIPSDQEKPQGETPAVTQGPLKTGLYIGASVTDDLFDAIIVAVLVDDNGVIADCAIEGYSENIATYKDFGLITNRKKVKSYGEDGSIAEWSEQADAMVKYAIGKTVDELKNGDIDCSGYATMNCVAGIEAAVANAQHLGAQSGDKLQLAVEGMFDYFNFIALVQAAAVSMHGDVITSCVIDELEGRPPYKNLQSRNQLGDQDIWDLTSSIGTEWYQQAASFSAYVTGMTGAEVDGIATDESGCPTDAQLAGSVDFCITTYQILIVRACTQ